MKYAYERIEEVACGVWFCAYYDTSFFQNCQACKNAEPGPYLCAAYTPEGHVSVLIGEGQFQEMVKDRPALKAWFLTIDLWNNILKLGA